MKVFIVLCSLIVVISATPTKIEDPQWEQFKSTHGKTYENIEEELQRYDVFIETLKEIEEHNKLYVQGLSTYEKGVTQFADWTHEEFVNYLKTFPRPEFSGGAAGAFVRPLNVEPPPSIDWREKKAVTPVKDQGQCGSCWAFSTTGSLEGQNAIKNQKLIPLSEQELVDCSKEEGNLGCNGGALVFALDYVKKHGLTSGKDYPYEAKDNTCRRDDKPSVIQIVGYNPIDSEDETGLEAAVGLVGPVSVAVDATNWKDYTNGIYNGDCESFILLLNHGVLAVGYGTDNKGQDYWIIKNSWGTKWGDKGYIKLPRHQNKCGVASAAIYPLL